MSVEQLIKELKKMPSTAQVIYQAHDNAENEIADIINRAILIDFDKLPQCSLQENKGVSVALRS